MSDFLNPFKEYRFWEQHKGNTMVLVQKTS